MENQNKNDNLSKWCNDYPEENISSESIHIITDNNKKNNYLLIIILIISILIIGIMLAVLAYMINNKEKNNNTIDKVSGSRTEAKVITTTTNKSEMNTTETQTTKKQANEEKTTISIVQKKDYVNTSVNKDDIYSQYLDIIYSMDFSPPYRGFLTDLNGDGVNEMIIPDLSDKSYRLYYYDNSKVKSCSFGGFMALDNFVMFSVDGNNGNKYLYYRDNYSYVSAQGYYSFDDNSEIDIIIKYPDTGNGTAEWSIYFNGTEQFANGTDSVNDIYGETEHCYTKLLESFKYYDFSISDSSKYNAIDGLYYDELIKKLGGGSQTTTTKVVAPKASITAKLSEEYAFQGVTIFLNVSGNYSSYSYTSYEYGVGSGEPYIKSGNSSANKIEVTAFSGGVSKIVVDVTPYNSDGVAGDTVSTTYFPSFGGSSNKFSVTQCTRYGTIYSPSGNKVDGLTKSYLIDGGAATYERHDLTHGWHITAVSEYYDGSIYWYELYDSDDGDYYGWVAEYNISFY